MAYRMEHPNPQFQRGNYECLNGTWGFAVGKADGRTNTELDGKIEVPFCPESVLSGIGDTRLITDCVYTREINVMAADLRGRLFLHFGAVDYYAEIYVNGMKVASHEGGYTSFEAEITPFVHEGTNRITVVVHDDVRENVPSGKQTYKEKPFGCFYTRVTGIWQSVWLERTPKEYIKSIKFFPDVKHGSVRTEVISEGNAPIEIEVRYNGEIVGHSKIEGGYRTNAEISLSKIYLWKIGCGRLYDVIVRMGDDEVRTYFGLRDIKREGNKILLNGKSIFSRLVLDQGYYKEGIYTPKSVEEMRRDIELAVSLGFNGARLHQRVFEQHYLYECDKAGFLVWGEYASWGVEYENLDALGAFTGQWRETVEQNFNHPSIIAWCPLNEAWSNIEKTDRVRDVRFVECIYALTKTLDPTRLCVDVSGGHHGKYTDIADFHCYGTYDVLGARLAKIDTEINHYPNMYREDEGVVYGGEPIQLSEFGGVSLTGSRVEESAYVKNTDAWGYTTATDNAAFVANYVRIVNMLLANKSLSGFCYTQLYDVEQEQNGFFTYERLPKLNENAMREITECNKQSAAIE